MAGNEAYFFNVLSVMLFYTEVYYIYNCWDVVDHIPRNLLYTYSLDHCGHVTLFPCKLKALWLFSVSVELSEQ